MGKGKSLAERDVFRWNVQGGGLNLLNSMDKIGKAIIPLVDNKR